MRTKLNTKEFPDLTLPRKLTKNELEIIYYSMDNNFQGDNLNSYDWQNVFSDPIEHMQSLFITDTLMKFDQICDTKEHADIFFRCYPSPKNFEESSYCLSHFIDERMNSQGRYLGRDNWILIQEKLNEIVKKFYGLKYKWGTQKVPDKVYKNDNKPIILTEEQLAKTSFSLNELKKILPYRSIYINNTLIGHAKDIVSSYLPVGEEQHYDDEDYRYYYHDINIDFFMIQIYEQVDKLIKKLPQDTIDRMFIRVTSHKEGFNYFVPRSSKVVLYSASGSSKNGIFIKDLKQLKIDGDKVFVESKIEPKTYNKEYVPYHKPSRPGRYFSSY